MQQAFAQHMVPQQYIMPTPVVLPASTSAFVQHMQSYQLMMQQQYYQQYNVQSYQPVMPLQQGQFDTYHNAPSSYLTDPTIAEQHYMLQQQNYYNR